MNRLTNQVPVLAHISDIRTILYTAYTHMYPHTTGTHTHTDTIHIHGPYKYLYCMHVFVVVSSFRNFRTIKVVGGTDWDPVGLHISDGCGSCCIARSFSVCSIGSRVACFVWRLPESTRNVFTACVTYFPNNNNHRP